MAETAGKPTITLDIDGDWLANMLLDGIKQEQPALMGGNVTGWTFDAEARRLRIELDVPANLHAEMKASVVLKVPEGLI